MRMIDVFCGTKSISNVFKDAGHEVLTIDWDSQHNPDICENILDVTAHDLLDFYGWDSVDYIHMSPDCTTYSIAACSHHRHPDGSPKSEAAHLAAKVLTHILGLIEELNPTYFTIENPRGLMRKQSEIIALSKKYNHACITYCQYGDTRMKPTDLFGRFPPSLRFKPMCKNGDSCHEAAPRGSRTGTQGLKNSVERSKIPRELCITLLKACEEGVNNG